MIGVCLITEAVITVAWSLKQTLLEGRTPVGDPDPPLALKYVH